MAGKKMPARVKQKFAARARKSGDTPAGSKPKFGSPAWRAKYGSGKKKSR